MKSLNATFFISILKKGGVKDLRDSRPIRLTGRLYKQLAKVFGR